MRFSYYKMINDMVVTLRDALCHVKASGDTSMIGVCIQSLQAIIKALSTCADDIKSSSIIEELNSMITSLSSQQPDIDKASVLAEKLILDCRSGLAYKIKVLFVAELGGKWDSMESVYEECMKRDDIDVDVVLQPVFREVRLSDGSIRHEEANYDWLTPMGINHIPYKEYDFKKESPDITFFSQPYEGCTVPMFWPENMAKYTRVVYLPYFAAITMNDISSFTSFFKLNTQKYSWRIACQSEPMKRLYEHNASFRGSNVVVTGLPKWDVPISINKGNTPVPNDWKKKIEGRVVFLWNTHFSTDSRGSQIFSEKALNFLDLFLNNKDNIALIWRPHPMLETVIKLYYPKEAWGFYLSLKKKINDSPNMVIDKEPSYVASFVWSDAIISDYSSLMDQYIFMHKPALMLTNDDIAEAREKFSKSELCDYSMLEFANNLEDECVFIENVCNNKGNEYVVRQDTIIKKYFGLADGRCGARLTELLVNDLKNEITYLS